MSDSDQQVTDCAQHLKLPTSWKSPDHVSVCDTCVCCMCWTCHGCTAGLTLSTEDERHKSAEESNPSDAHDDFPCCCEHNVKKQGLNKLTPRQPNTSCLHHLKHIFISKETANDRTDKTEKISSWFVWLAHFAISKAQNIPSKSFFHLLYTDTIYPVTYKWTTCWKPLDKRQKIQIRMS